MEHLIYDPSPRAFRSEVRAAANGPLDVSDWALYDRHYGLCPQIAPGIPWLGHDHVASSYYHRRESEYQPMLINFHKHYGPEWDIEEMLRIHDIRRAHPSLRGADLSEAVHRTAAFIQARLYLGLLESICARPIATSYMVRTSHDGEENLYSRNLPILLETWTRSLLEMEAGVRKEAWRQARECAVAASSILGDILAHVSRAGSSASFSDLRTLVLSTEPALSALFEAIARVTEVHLLTEVSSFGAPSLPFPKPYSDNLIGKGWCRFVIASAEIALSPSLLRFVDAAGFASTSTGHEHCTADQCERNLIQVETYTQGHWPRNCRCRSLKPDTAQVFEILDAGCIPVVQLEANGSSFELGGIHPDDRKADYIAFSHVWADGLGSSTEAGLPVCQIRRLHQLVEKRTEHGAWFWIDGLCVPKQEPYRGKAIELMKFTYQNATGVIVLDEGLRKVSTNSSGLEIGWSLFASGWFGRLWTYQEGFLPPWVDLELGDGLVDLYSLIQNLYRFYMDRKASQFPAVFVQGLVAVLQKVRPLDLRHYKRSRSRRTVDLFNAMTRRRSSRPDDQLLVFGLMLDLEIGPLLEVRGEDRWKAFYMSLGKIPWTVVFDQRPKMQRSPFTWAPSTWISSGKDQWLHYDEELADIADKGLAVALTVLVLDEPSTVHFSRLLIQAEQNRYELSRSNEATGTVFQWFNVVFVRYFKHEHPQSALQENSSLLLRVGLGLRGATTAAPLQYDFAGCWEIRSVTESEVVEASRTNTIRGNWDMVQCCFA